MRRKLILLIALTVGVFFFAKSALAIRTGPPPPSFDCDHRSPECSNKETFPEKNCEEIPNTGPYSDSKFVGCVMTSSDQTARGCRMTLYDSNDNPIKYSCAHVNQASPPPPPPAAGYNCNNRSPGCPADKYKYCKTMGAYETCSRASDCQFDSGLINSVLKYCASGQLRDFESCDPADTLPNHGCADGSTCRTTGTDNTCQSNTAPTPQLLDAPCAPSDRVNPSGDPDPGGNCKTGAGIHTALGSISTDVPGFTKWLLTIVLSVAGIIVIFIIIATGYRMMVSQGDPEKVKEAREALTAAVVGLLFIIFSLVILQFITVDILHIPGFNR